MSLRFSEKAAIVTGGGSGIGQSVSELFAREGCSVAILDLNQDGMDETLKLLDTNHGNIHCTIKADVSSSDQAKEAFKTAEEKLGKKITVLVNCAGIATTPSSFDQMQETVFDDLIRVNLKGTFIMCKQFLLSLEKFNTNSNDTRATVVNISSAAVIKCVAEVSDYIASKFGVVGITKTLALEYGKHKVRCNAVLPGLTITPLLKTFPRDFLQAIEEVIPMKRLAKPEEIAKCILFLASNESSYVNGACLEITGGYGL
uniref:estradiol 17-beta-dehydrogenase 8-like n=1 Tax=Styela clava TaxID=7725 RepID=UPI001939FDDC|nr:estradiol 17-beta-dehydrogenase 8-like [Styela clava]